MDMTLRNDYGERCQFDAYCKLMLYNEAIDCLREMQRRRDRELSFSDLPQMEMDKLCVVKLIEPSYTERYARRCERSGNLVKFPFLLDLQNLSFLKIYWKE